MFAFAVVQTKVISCNSANKSCLLQVVHTKAITALTQFYDFCHLQLNTHLASWCHLIIILCFVNLFKKPSGKLADISISGDELKNMKNSALNFELTEVILLLWCLAPIVNTDCSLYLYTLLICCKNCFIYGTYEWLVLELSRMPSVYQCYLLHDNQIVLFL